MLHHLGDLVLPRFFVGEPRVLRDLLRTLPVIIVQGDRNARRQAAHLEVVRPDPDEFRVGDSHSFRLEGQIDGALLDDGVNVIPPRVIIEQAVNGKPELAIQAVKQTAHAAGGLAAAVGQDAIMLFPEFILVEPLPDCVFFDVQDEFRLAEFRVEGDDFRLDDGGDPVAAGTHS